MLTRALLESGDITASQYFRDVAKSLSVLLKIDERLIADCRDGFDSISVIRFQQEASYCRLGISDALYGRGDKYSPYNGIEVIKALVHYTIMRDKMRVVANNG